MMRKTGRRKQEKEEALRYDIIVRGLPDKHGNRDTTSHAYSKRAAEVCAKSVRSDNPDHVVDVVPVK